MNKIINLMAGWTDIFSQCLDEWTNPANGWMIREQWIGWSVYCHCHCFYTDTNHLLTHRTKRVKHSRLDFILLKYIFAGKSHGMTARPSYSQNMTLSQCTAGLRLLTLQKPSNLIYRILTLMGGELCIFTVFCLKMQVTSDDKPHIWACKTLSSSLQKQF